MYTSPNDHHWTSKNTSSISTNRHLRKTMVSPHTLFQILFIVALIPSTQGFIGSDDEQALQLNDQLLLQNQPESNIKSRLATLLELRQSIKALMHQRDDELSRETDNTIEDNTIDNSAKEIVTPKRVFCNGFTGCGGRFRGRWVQQLALEDMKKRMEKAAASKRPFCNTNGCFNGGKRKKDATGSTLPGPDGKTYFLSSDLSDDGTPSSGADRIGRSRSPSKEKRLFCNGYGGCQNMGKRGLLLPMLVGDRPSPLDETYLVEKPTKPVFEITLEPNKIKRFFAANADSDLDELIARMHNG